MYEDYYKLSACPFRLTPDRKFYFGSEGHRKAMSYLKYGLYQGEGFIVITGDVGTGKSTLVAQLFEDLDTQNIVAAQIGTTQVDADDAVRLICSAFQIQVNGTEKSAMLSAIEEFLIDQHQKNRRVLLVIDEAQNLPMRTLEELRMLSNFNISGQSLFQCFLVGQPQFLRTLGHPDMAQLQQRVIASYRLEPMNEEETKAYILHRLRTVGWQGTPDFTDDACAIIHQETHGVPRRINTVCNRVMLYGALEELSVFNSAVIEQVIKDLQNEAANANPRLNPTSVQQHASSDLSATTSAAETLAQRSSLPPSAPLSSAPSSTISTKEAKDISGDYSPYLAQAEMEQTIKMLQTRIDQMQSVIAEHEKALQELIDVAIGFLSPESNGESTSATSLPRTH